MSKFDTKPQRAPAESRYAYSAVGKAENDDAAISQLEMGKNRRGIESSILGRDARPLWRPERPRARRGDAVAVAKAS